MDNKKNIIKKKYIEFINFSIENFSSKKEILEAILEKINNEDNYVFDVANKYNNSINAVEKNKKYLLERKSELFHKNSEVQFFKKINFRKLIESCDNKNKMWEHLQFLYVLNEHGNEKSSDYIVKLINCIEENNSKPKTDDTQEDNSEKTNADNIIADIAESVQNSVMNMNSSGNPLENILKASQKIAEKYESRIKNNNIQPEDMFKSLQKMMGDMGLGDMKENGMPDPNELLNNYQEVVV